MMLRWMKQRKAQIENVVKRKTGIAAKNITITPTNNQ